MKQRSRLILAVLSIGMVLGLGVVNLLSPAKAAAYPESGQVCSWYWNSFGRSSNCDNKYSDTYECYRDVRVARRTTLSSSDPSIELSLLYSPRCRTVWASLGVRRDNGSVVGTCDTKVQRNSDGKRLYDGGLRWHTYLFATATTPMLYDANVTSFAWARCYVDGHKYEGRTSSY